MHFTFYQSNPCLLKIMYIRDKLDQLEKMLSFDDTIHKTILVPLQAIEDKLTILLQRAKKDTFQTTYTDIIHQIDNLLHKEGPQQQQSVSMEKVYKVQRRQAFQRNFDHFALIQERNLVLDQMTKHVEQCQSGEAIFVSNMMVKEDQYLWYTDREIRETKCSEGKFLNEQMELIQTQLYQDSSPVKGCVIVAIEK